MKTNLLPISKLRQRFSSISNWQWKGLVVSLLCLTAFLTFVDVRATQPAPLVGIGQSSTFGGQYGKVCSSTNGADVQVLSQSVPIGSGHAYWFKPAIFTGVFNVSSAINPSYTVEFYVNGSAYGSVTGNAPPSGVRVTASYVEPMSNIVVYQFFNFGQTGPQTLVWTVDIATASGQTVCVQNSYIYIGFGFT
jgi:hypothetical protein